MSDFIRHWLHFSLRESGLLFDAKAGRCWQMRYSGVIVVSLNLRQHVAFCADGLGENDSSAGSCVCISRRMASTHHLPFVGTLSLEEWNFSSKNPLGVLASFTNARVLQQWACPELAKPSQITVIENGAQSLATNHRFYIISYTLALKLQEELEKAFLLVLNKTQEKKMVSFECVRLFPS